MSAKEIAPRITVDPEVCFGKPVVAGTRIHVAVILGQLAAGDPANKIAAEYGISKEDVLACVGFAHRIIEKSWPR